MKVSQSHAPRVAKPTYEKLAAQLTVLDKKIATASTALTAHKEMMMRSRFTAEGLKTATAQLKKLEKNLHGLEGQRTVLVKEMSRLRPAAPTDAALTASIEKHLKADDLKFTGTAPRAADILKQTTVNHRPFSYTAIVLKNDPSHVVIKKVLTGGFVPARPGDGVYSKPVAL